MEHTCGEYAICQAALFGNVREFAHFVIGKNKTLSFDIPALAVKRKDNLDVQQRILTMTSAGQK